MPNDIRTPPESFLEIDSYDTLVDLPDGTVILWDEETLITDCTRQAAVLYTTFEGERSLKHTVEGSEYYELDRIGLPAMAIVWARPSEVIDGEVVPAQPAVEQ
ncbi:hypothetical protein [Mycobacterium sp. D16R24]|uniref:hypothetical protein n=1 Tax=Mycobacterium sp. D16R24 TaxID=1855656 RepID=UPI00099395DA|nr:hypothetical protein [Mycobacterium sp. D16R24]